MKKFFQKQREVITILVYVCVIIALIYFVVLPLLARISSTRDQIQEEHMKQDIKQQQISELPKMEEQYNILQSNEKSVDVLLDKNDAVLLIERLEKLAQDSNNEISISVQDVATQKNATVVTNSETNTDNELVNDLPSTDYLQMKIILTGDYNTMMNFVHSLESSEYYCDIIAIQINQKEKTNEVSNIGMNTLSNPSNPNITKNIKETTDSNNDNKIEASLDVVFYTKK